MPALIGWPGVVEYCQVSLNIEDVVDGGMGGEKSLDTKRVRLWAHPTFEIAVGNA
jgi:hypothetical protein